MSDDGLKLLEVLRGGYSTTAESAAYVTAHPGYEPQFARSRHGSSVHVLRMWHGHTVVGDEYYPNHSALLLTGVIRCWTMCGVAIDLEPTGHGHRTDDFTDEELCTRCYRAFPEAERDRLFEHGDVSDQ